MSNRRTQPGGDLARALAGVADSMRRVVVHKPWPLENPIVVQFPVNDICDSKCQMCNIWQQKRDREISPEEVRELFANKLFSHVRAVGLNGGEPTLRRDLPEIGAALFDSLPRLERLSLITNGLQAERAIERIDALGSAVRGRGGRLDVMVSLDGVAAIHDRVRGVIGNFESAVRVLDYLLARPHGMTTRVGCTVIRDNVYGLHDLLDFCVSRRVYVKFRLGVPNRRLYNLPSPAPKQIGKRTWIDTQPFGLSPEQRWHFGQFLLGLIADYEIDLAQVQFYRSLVGQLVYDRPRAAGCDWQNRGVTVTARGEISYCAVQSDVLGDGLSEDPEKLYFGNRSHLDQILATKCGSCAHDYVGPPGGFAQLQLLVDRGLRLFGRDLRQVARSRPAQSLKSLKRRWIDPPRFAVRRRRLLESVARASASPSGSTGRDVLICGWYGTETLGDKAILAAIVGLIRREDAAARIVVVSLDAVYTRLTVAQMEEMSGCQVIGPEDALIHVGRCRVVIFGGGPLMAIREMASMEVIFRKARAMGVPSIVAGCGVGPLGAPSLNRSIASLLSMANQRIFRDDQSRVLASAALGVDSLDDPVCEDPATTWLHSLGTEAPTPRPGRVLALGLREWPFSQYAPRISGRAGQRICDEFESNVVTALETLVRTDPGLRILPVPFCTHDVGGDDRLLYWRLVRRSAVLREAFDKSLLSAELSPRRYVAILRSVTAILTMRFHSLVFASALRIPAVAIDYTGGIGKTHALASALQIPVHAVEAVDASGLAKQLAVALSGRPPGVPAEPAFPVAFSRAWQATVERPRTPEPL